MSSTSSRGVIPASCLYMYLVKYSLTYKEYLLRKRECQAEVIFSVLRGQRAPIKDVRVEDMDEGTEG